MNRVKVLSICLLFLLAALGGSAALHPGVRRSLAPPGAILLQSSPAAPQKSPANSPKSTVKHPTNRLGDWLQSHKDLPLDQQEKALERDPKFKKLTPERQAALKERLRKFNALPPEQRQSALRRMNYIARLSQEQRQQLRDANQKLEALPQDRKVMVHTALRQLLKMDQQQRTETIESERFHSTFSEQEQSIIKQLSAITPQTGASAAPSTGQMPK